jgi:hypothetical protein
MEKYKSYNSQEVPLLSISGGCPWTIDTLAELVAGVGVEVGGGVAESGRKPG